MNTSHPYDLVIGLDRSDKKADLRLIDTITGQRRSQTIDTAPEALWEWLLQLRQDYPQARVALCLEQPAVHLIAFLEAYDWITLYPINPITLQKYREAFVTSRAKDDAKDADYMASPWVYPMSFWTAPRPTASGENHGAGKSVEVQGIKVGL